MPPSWSLSPALKARILLTMTSLKVSTHSEKIVKGHWRVVLPLVALAPEPFRNWGQRILQGYSQVLFALCFIRNSPYGSVLQERIGHLPTRPGGRPPKRPQVFFASFAYRAQSWTKPLRGFLSSHRHGPHTESDSPPRHRSSRSPLCTSRMFIASGSLPQPMLPTERSAAEEPAKPCQALRQGCASFPIREQK